MRWLLGVVAAMALLAAGCGGTTGAGTSGADIVPASAPAFVAINSDTGSSQWQTVDKLASRFPGRAKAMRVFTDGLNGAGLSWKRDIKPALGPELDIVWLDFDNNGQDFVVLMQPKDESKFHKLMKDAEQSADFFRAKIHGWQVMATSQDALDRFRREGASGGTLADRGAFKQAMATYPTDSLFRAYVDGAAVMELARREQNRDFKKILPKLGRLDWFATNLRVTSDGVRWDVNAHGTPGSALKGLSPTRPFTPTLSSEVPKDALAYFSFHGTKGMLTNLQGNPILRDVPELRRYSGLLRQVESILQGENALYVRPAASGDKIPEVTFVSEPARGTDGAATLTRLLTRYRSRLQLPARPKATTVGGVKAYSFSADPVRIYYANVGNRLVLTDRPVGIETLGGNPPALSESGDYKGVVDSAGMPAKTQGFLYVNVRGGIRYAQRLANVPLPDEVKGNLGPLRSAVEYAATRPSELQLTFFLRIK